MSKIEIVLPAMGEGIVDATITRWLVNVGDTVTEDQSLVEVATDKVDSEIPAPASGKVKELIFNEGDVPQIGQTIAILEVDGKTSARVENEPETPKIITEPKPEPSTKEPKQIASGSISIPNSEKLPTLSPLVRTIVKKEGISVSELNSITGNKND